MATNDSLPARVLAHIGEARLFRAPGEALVAVSGGPDSVALLDLLHGMAGELGITLAVVHVDHGIQSDGRTVGRHARGALWSAVRTCRTASRPERNGNRSAPCAIRLAARPAESARREVSRHRASPGRPGGNDLAARAAWQRASGTRGHECPIARWTGAAAPAVLAPRARGLRERARAARPRRSRQPGSSAPAVLAPHDAASIAA